MIPTPHPAITFGSLALISGMLFYELRHGVHKHLAWWVVFLVMIAISSVSRWSTHRRAKEIKAKHAPSTLRKAAK